MWNSKRVSVVLPTFNERDSIRSVIAGFYSTGFVDEVIVVNNNAAPGTSEEVRGTGAIEISEPRQGYGWAIRKGLEIASGDLIILSEPDATFEPRDVVKLLAYSDDFHYVLGTRTTREFIWAGANMGWFLRWGNWAVAKLIEVLFNCSILTDVGCTMRLLSRDTVRRVRGAFAVGGSQFGPHLTLLVIAAGIPFTEISLNYRPRVGVSSVTGDFWKALRLGFQMIGLIAGFRLKTAMGVLKKGELIPFQQALPPEMPSVERARANIPTKGSSRSLFDSRRTAWERDKEPTP